MLRLLLGPAGAIKAAAEAPAAQPLWKDAELLLLVWPPCCQVAAAGCACACGAGAGAPQSSPPPEMGHPPAAPPALLDPAAGTAQGRE